MRQLLNSLVDVGFAMILYLSNNISGDWPKFSSTDNRPELYNVGCIHVIDCRIVDRNNPAVNRLAI